MFNCFPDMIGAWGSGFWVVGSPHVNRENTDFVKEGLRSSISAC